MWSFTKFIVICSSISQAKSWNINYGIIHKKPTLSRNKVLFQSSIRSDSGPQQTLIGGDSGIYRPFATHAWNTLQSKGFISPSSEISSSDNKSSSSKLVPNDLAENDALAKGPDGLRVKIEVQGAEGSSSTSALRLARYALLETRTSASVPVQSGIHVLNLVLFPKTNLDNVPIFGADLVTLPGNKHLVVIDFQPFLKQSSHGENKEEVARGLLRLPNEKLQKRLEDLHELHVVKNEKDMPWGGDIPPKAQRFFSNYALWTRLIGEEALDIVHTKVYDAFVDYLDLYIDILKAAENEEQENYSRDELMEGHTSYLNYRRENDPARPMLKRCVLYMRSFICKLYICFVALNCRSEQMNFVVVCLNTHSFTPSPLSAFMEKTGRKD